jgi:hypothetical protein
LYQKILYMYDIFSLIKVEKYFMEFSLKNEKPLYFVSKIIKNKKQNKKSVPNKMLQIFSSFFIENKKN